VVESAIAREEMPIRVSTYLCRTGFTKDSASKVSDIGAQEAFLRSNPVRVACEELEALESESAGQQGGNGRDVKPS
jgi:hypothetical protein